MKEAIQDLNWSIDNWKETIDFQKKMLVRDVEYKNDLEKRIANAEEKIREAETHILVLGLAIDVLEAQENG